MNRLLLVVLLATTVFGSFLDEHLKILEDLEDLLGDEHLAAYSNERNPDLLLNQFNSAKESLLNKRKLAMYLRKLEDEDCPFCEMLSGGELEALISRLRKILHQQQTCNAAPYGFRTIDGTCNNVAKSDQGSAGTAFKRTVASAYDDGLSGPRTMSVDGGPLRNARDISSIVFKTGRGMFPNFTQIGMHLGQLADHDVSASHSTQVDCPDCSVEGECFSIPIDAADPVYGGNKDCFTLRRSKSDDDSSGVRQQTNFITSYLDASFVYGSDAALAAELTQESSGSMKHVVDKVTGRELLPPDKELQGCAGVNEEAGIWCGKAGDHRAAEQPGITALQTLFLREHNRIARELRRLDPSLIAQDVYQKARKILGAEWQHIIYNEYLPLITGADLFASKSLAPDAPYSYNPDVDASVANVFAAAAFRFGHSQVPIHFKRVKGNFRGSMHTPNIPMKEAFFNATFMFDESIPDGAVDSVLRGMTVQPLYKVDRIFPDGINKNLFGDPALEGDGFDLTALDIQRGRDHGLPSYNTIRTDFCGLPEINSFEELVDNDIMELVGVRRLKKAYSNVKDVDAFVGMVLENHLPNTLVGPTLACIFADQFHRFKFGDRFFYQNPDQFTSAQIQEIQKATAARLMCDNVQAVQEIQPFVFIAAQNFQSGSVAEEGYTGPGGRPNKGYDSFYEYSRSGTWPHKRAYVLDGLDNSRVECASDLIPVLDLSKFI